MSDKPFHAFSQSPLNTPVIKVISPPITLANVSMIFAMMLIDVSIVAANPANITSTAKPKLLNTAAISSEEDADWPVTLFQTFVMVSTTRPNVSLIRWTVPEMMLEIYPHTTPAVSLKFSQFVITMATTADNANRANPMGLVAMMVRMMIKAPRMPFTSPPAKSVRIKVIAPVIAVPIEAIMPVTTPIIALPAPDISPGIAPMPFTMAIGARPIMVNT